jgi:hypothetical protein
MGVTALNRKYLHIKSSDKLSFIPVKTGINYIMKKKILFVSLLFILFSSFLTLTLSAQAQGAADTTINGLNEAAGGVGAFADQIKPASDTTSYGTGFLATKAGQIIGLILSFIGVLFLGLMIYAGITWMMANGNEQTVASAKAMIVNAAIGIAIVFAAYAITSFLGTELLKQ